MEETTQTPSASAAAPTRWNSFEVWLAIIALASATNSIVGSSLPVAYFALITAGLALLGKLGHRPKDIGRFVRTFFYRAGEVARSLLIVLAIGGTFLVFDLTFRGFDPLPPWLDVWVKRAAPGVIGMTMTMIWGAYFANRIQHRTPQDAVLRGYEFPFYVMLIVFGISWTLLWLGHPVELSLDSAQVTPSTVAGWSKVAAQVLRILVGVSFIWALALSMILWTRLHELAAGETSRSAGTVSAEATPVVEPLNSGAVAA